MFGTDFTLGVRHSLDEASTQVLNKQKRFQLVYSGRKISLINGSFNSFRDLSHSLSRRRHKAAIYSAFDKRTGLEAGLAQELFVFTHGVAFSLSGVHEQG